MCLEGSTDGTIRKLLDPSCGKLGDWEPAPSLSILECQEGGGVLWFVAPCISIAFLVTMWLNQVCTGAGLGHEAHEG